MTMTAELDEALFDDDPSKLFVRVETISNAYSTKLAFDLLEAYYRPFKRVVEDVRVEHGQCRRQLTIDWRLPTLAEAFPEDRRTEDERFTTAFADQGADLVVPVLPMRKNDMMNEFAATGPNGQRLYVCGQDESVHHTWLMLSALWQLVERTSKTFTSAQEVLLKQVHDAFFALPGLSAGKARDAVSVVSENLERLKAQLDSRVRARIILVARYMARHHIIWMRIPNKPGDSLRLTMTYQTRFAAGYSPLRGGTRGLGNYHFLRRMIDWSRRVSGQEPYRFAVPVSMSALCQSYHFQMSAPPAMYFASQRFTLESNLHQSRDEQNKALLEHCEGNGAYVSGEDEAGGPVAHLYARDLPATADNSLYAYTQVRERPPGTTALVMWLALLTAGFLWFYYCVWQWLVSSDTQGIDLASMSVALPGVASLWFSHAFREDVRTRVPLVSRLGLLLVGVATLYSLLTILVRRVICTATGTNSTTCPAPLDDIFSRPGLVGVAGLMTVITVWLLVRRISFHREYQRLQANAITRYMS
jgi:hypothetical protein